MADHAPCDVLKGETMTSGAFHPAFDALPTSLPIFPLQGALLLPWGKLPLNIFEPRYLAMIEECLGQGRMIGMIQPRKAYRAPGDDPVPLYSVGCAGRVTAFSENPDGRFLITLTGVIRFHIDAELPQHVRGYRVVRPTWTAFADDLSCPTFEGFDRNRLISATETFIGRHDLPLNVRLLEELGDCDLINTLAMICPFEVQEKQALLEISTFSERAEMVLALLEMAQYTTTGASQSPQ